MLQFVVFLIKERDALRHKVARKINVPFYHREFWNCSERSMSHLSMIFESPGGTTGSQVPKSQGLVPGTGKSVVAVRGEDDITDEVGMSIKTLLGNTVISFVAS